MRCPDDPNLHWPRYGCVDYRRFAEHARQQHYHVAFATIPLLLATYLGQALVLCAHHRDCRDDLERFAEAARFINGLGDVRWADLPTLSRMNYQWRTRGARCSCARSAAAWWPSCRATWPVSPSPRTRAWAARPGRCRTGRSRRWTVAP